jgi:predicted porin
MNLCILARLSAGITATSLACIPSFAQNASGSSVSIYGTIDAYAGSLRRSDQADRALMVNSGGMTTSFWGLRGAEDLGGGLQTVFALESFFQSDTGATGRTSADPYFSRNAYVGIGGAWGQLSAGRQTNLLYSATGAFNPFLASANLSPVMLQVWSPGYNRAVLGDSVWNNTVQYISPQVAGFKVGIAYGAGEVAARSEVRNLNLTVNYERGPFAAVVSGQQARTGPGLTEKILRQDVQMAGLSFDLRYTKVYGQFVWTRTPDIQSRTHTVQLGMAVPVGAGRLMASASHTDRDLPTVDAHRTTLAIGYDHFLSKRTDLYAVYLSDKLSGFSRSGNLALGVRHRF